MQLLDANVRSASYFVAKTADAMRALRPALPGFRIMPATQSSKRWLTDEWQTIDASAFIFHVVGLPDSVSRLLFDRTADFHQTRVR